MRSGLIIQLQKEIQHLQGLRPVSPTQSIELGLPFLEAALPHAAFPTSAVHEFISTGQEAATATSGFVAALLSTLMKRGGIIVWISRSRDLFPPGVKSFGIEPHRIVFVDLDREKDVLWALEESLKCAGLTGVVAELQEISFTESRRLQLAVEQSRVTGFILRQDSRKINVTACVTRWKITSLPSVLDDGMPGVGYPRWQVELLKVRSGKPGAWQVEWQSDHLVHVSETTIVTEEFKQKRAG